MPRRCPCGLRTFETCCAPFLRGERRPDTAEALMRSRYAAYVEGAVDYLLDTTAAGPRAALDRAALVDYCRDLRGFSLLIVETHAGGPDDQHGVVVFEARLRAGGRRFLQRERSRFVREEGRWVYAGGEPA